VTSWTSFPGQVASAGRLFGGLSAFLRRPPVSAAECRARLEASLATRAARFLELARRGIFEHPPSPYRPLFARARVEFDDLARLVAEHGVEGTLDRLGDAGVRITLDEFKGRQPIVVDGREVDATEDSFDNPLLTRHYETRSSGSKGPGTRTIVDLDLLEHEGLIDGVFLDDFDLARRPKALWRTLPPGAAGLKETLRFARVGQHHDVWFSPMLASLRDDPGHAMFIALIALAGRLHGHPLPWPRHVPLGEAVTVARWLARRRASHGPPYLSTTASCAVRVCAAALDHGLDISSTYMRTGGEPLSPGKMKIITAAGCEAHSNFGMAEVGRIGVACARPVAADDMHVMTEKLAVLQRPATHAPVGGLWLTTLHWSVPKIMLNVEIGDTAVFERRACGCAWDRLGFHDHLHTIFSYDKLTTEGMHFVGTDLIALAEEVLPARFGGAPTDYQFVEEERDGLPSVLVLVSPRVGKLDEAAVVAAVLDHLASHDRGHRLMTALWKQSGTLRVVRQEPDATSSGKIQALSHRRFSAGGR
jgi:hypothetical protein